MPTTRSPMPINMTNITIVQLGPRDSKSSYKGLKTINSVPASRSASPNHFKREFLGWQGYLGAWDKDLYHNRQSFIRGKPPH
jgi:hypothetical protein